MAGLDLGDKHSFVCLIDLDGNVVERKKLRTSLAALERYLGEWAGMRVVFEAGTHANWVYRLLGRLEHEPLMADTHRLALITQSLSKDDRTDAERLAELGLRLPEMLNPVQPASLETQADRTVLNPCPRSAQRDSHCVAFDHSTKPGKNLSGRALWPAPRFCREKYRPSEPRGTQAPTDRSPTRPLS